MIAPDEISEYAQRPSLVLASASPRRRQFLADLGVDFVIHAADIDETRQQAEKPGAYVQRLAQEKAAAVAERQQAKSPGDDIAVLAADTIVTQGETIFGKPEDEADAFQMWRALANNEHIVMTAICLLWRGNSQLELVQSKVRFSAIDDAQMTRYWQSGEPADKAGAYAIQGLASAWVQLMHGSYSNVVGLPLYETNRLLKSIGHNWL